MDNFIPIFRGVHLGQSLVEGKSHIDAIRALGGGRPDYLTDLYLLAGAIPPHSLIVEIGCNLGESTLVMGMAIKGKESLIVTIDPVFIDGSISIPDSYSPVQHNHYSNTIGNLLCNVAHFHLEGYITVIPDYSWDALARWDGRLIDMLFVDGEHTNEAVKKDCEWMEYVKPGGIAAFDDFFPEIRRAVNEYLAGHPGWNEDNAYSAVKVFRKS